MSYIHTYFSGLRETQESPMLANIMKSRAQVFILISGQLTSPEIAQYMIVEARNEMARMINLDLNKISILNDKYGPYCKPLLDRQGIRMR